jgi:hypothetical protein
MAIEISLHAFVWVAARLALDADNDYVYPKEECDDQPSGITCHYVRDGKASCFIAQILNYLGVRVNVLMNYEETPARKVLHALRSLEILTAVNNEDFDKVVAFAATVQTYQDTGSTWKDSYIEASKSLV